MFGITHLESMFTYGESRWLICTRCRSFSYFLLQMFFSQFCYILFLFINNEDQASDLKVAYICKLLLKLLNGCFSSLTNVCEECSNFGFQNRHLQSVTLKFSQKCFWDSSILVYCWFENYFMFIAKEKLHFSLICSFYCCLVKGGWALKVA